MEQVELTAVEGGTDAPVVKTAKFGQLDSPAAPASSNTMDLLLDVQLELSVELGRAALSVKDVLGMGAGSVIELDKLGGEPVDILVNGKMIARGEVVVVDENFGVRVTEIVGKASGSVES
jgi:flagellar motor switch protein FliN/FliY